MGKYEEDRYGLNCLVELEGVSLSDNHPENSKVGYAVTAYELQDQNDDQKPGAPLRYALPVTAHYTSPLTIFSTSDSWCWDYPYLYGEVKFTGSFQLSKSGVL